MDPMGEEQLDYGDDEYGGSQKSQFQGGGAISALAEEEMMGEDDEYDDLYNDVNVGEGFMQTLQHRAEPSALFGKGGPQNQKMDAPRVAALETGGGSQSVTIPGVGVEGKDMKASSSFAAAEPKRGGFFPAKGPEEGIGNHPDGVLQKGRSALDMSTGAQGGSMAFRGGSSVPIPPKVDGDPKFSSGSSSLPPDSGPGVIRSGPPMPMNQPGLIGHRPVMNETPRPPMGSIENNGPTMLFVGELHWWTTDAELESVLSQYGRVKEIKFFDERASGKSKGYCQVEFYDPAAAAACKEGMNGHVFNGRSCVVAFASPQTLKQMGQSYMNKTQGQAQAQTQGRRQMNDGTGRGGGMNVYGGDGGRNNGKAGWGRGGQGLLNRGQGGGGVMRGRGPLGMKGMVGGTAGIGAGLPGGPYGQGLGGPVLGGPAGGLMHPQTMMGTGFDPTYMGHGAAYGGFSGPAFPGMMPSFPAVNTVGLPGVAPHVNPAFFGRGMTTNGMGMLGNSGMDANSAGMWTDTSMGGWTGEEHGRRTRESSFVGDDGASEYGYGDASHDRGGRPNASREKDRGSERDWSGNSEKRYHDEREQDWDKSNKDRYREEKDGYRDHRQRDRDYDNEDDWDRGQSSLRSRSKSRMMQQEDDRSRSRDADYGKKRRVPE